MKNLVIGGLFAILSFCAGLSVEFGLICSGMTKVCDLSVEDCATAITSWIWHS